MKHSDPTPYIAAIIALETACNRALKLDPTSYQRLNQFNGQVFHIECLRPNFNLYLRPTENFLLLSHYYEGPVTTAIRGNGSEFAKLAVSDDPAGVLINSGISLSGDSAPLIELQQLISKLDLDWEAPLVNTLGDLPGHQLASCLRSLFSWSRQAEQRAARQWQDFLQEELQITPSQAEAENFYFTNGRLSQKVDRIEARISKLRQHLDGLGKNLTGNS